MITSALVLECLKILRELAKHDRVTLIWVPGHDGIEGNKRADELAKKGFDGSFVSPGPFCSYSLNHFKILFVNWVKFMLFCVRKGQLKNFN